MKSLTRYLPGNVGFQGTTVVAASKPLVTHFLKHSCTTANLAVFAAALLAASPIWMSIQLVQSRHPVQASY